MPRKLIKARKVAAMVGVSAKTVKRWANSLESDFPLSTLLGGEHFWDAAEVERWIESKFKARERRYVEVANSARSDRKMKS